MRKLLLTLVLAAFGSSTVAEPRPPRRPEDIVRSFLNVPGLIEGRLTLESGVPISNSDQTAKSTLYFTPYRGKRVALYNGTLWTLYDFSQISLTLSGLTSARNYDVFLHDNSGTLTLTLSNAWTSNTVRNEALTTQDGILVKSGATTRRYLGTIRSTSTTTTEDSALRRFVWNYRNQSERPLKVSDSTDNWNFTTDTFRSYDNSTANRVEFVVGWSESPVMLMFAAIITNSTAGFAGRTGIGLDVTNASNADIFPGTGSQGSFSNPIYSMYYSFPGIGYHFLQLVEARGGTGTTFIYGDAGNANVLGGAVGWIDG